MDSGYSHFQNALVDKKKVGTQVSSNDIPLAFAHISILYANNGHAKDIVFKQVNEKFSSLAELPREFIIGKKLSDISSDFDEIYNKEISQVTMGSLEFFPPKHELYISSIKKWFEVFVNFVNKDEATLLIDDCTERKVKEQSLTAEKSVKSDFLANMSHEIRTPLNGILGFTEILSVLEKDERKKGMLNLVEDCGNQLLEIVNDIFNYSYIESGKLIKKKIRFDPMETILDTTGFFEQTADKKGLELKVNVNNVKEKHVVGDVVKLNQVIVNLIGNAIKFTDHGKIEITAKTYHKNNLVYLNLVIADSGIGIDPARIDTIFDEFKQLDHYLTKRIRGIGIGLTITKKIIDFLGGDIKVISKPKNGSTFVIDIPFNEIMEQNKSKKELSTKKIISGKMKKIKILLAEDNEANQFLIKALTKNTDWELTIVDDGQQAVEAFKNDEFDLVLMDVQMPNMNGYDATKMIRELEQGKDAHTPVIALTAFAMKSDKDQCMEAGMDDYISKPFKRQEFMDMINKSIKQKED